MSPRIRNLPWRRLAPVGVAAALLIPAAPGATAAAPDQADVFGQWTAPFEEGGAGVPRCAPVEDGSGFLVCKPTAQAAALLPDGRVFYYNGLESWFHDGWLRTGDAGTVDRRGFVRITDRVKDVIKSGGEWISSVELENQLMAHPDVAEAAVIGVPDQRWDERPLACVVLKQAAPVKPEELSAFLAERIPRLWLPERWSLIDKIPKTSVDKFDKKALRDRYAAGSLVVEEVARVEH